MQNLSYNELMITLSLILSFAQATYKPVYEVRDDHDINGIGVFYMGREIAQVMGHQAAEWLERPERFEEEAPQMLLQGLKLKPGMVVADVGAGSGYLSFPMAKQVGPTGKVYAEEIQQEMLDIVVAKSKRLGVKNVVPWLGTTMSTTSRTKWRFPWSNHSKKAESWYSSNIEKKTHAYPSKKSTK